MEFLGLKELLSTLSISIKLVPKNGKLMAFIALFFTTLNSSLSLFNYSLKSVMSGMASTTQQFVMPGASFDLVKTTHLLNQLRRDNAFLFAIEVSFLLSFFIVSFFFAVSTILVSSVSYNATNSTLNELVSMIRGSWRRALITSLYVSAFSNGYFATIAMFAIPTWIYPDLPTFWLGMAIGIPSLIVYLYLVVPWILSVVISVTEESYGLEAIGRAGTLVKGKRVQGFLLNVLYCLVVVIIFLVCYQGELRLETMTFIGVSSVNSLVMMSMFVAYTVFYFKCKMHNGDEVRYTELFTADALAKV